ncbi:hypothetical protein RA2_01661 [Roseovarius sp. A-2]|uniref:DUF6525 family protein n=1 Tax=Roseovarius sp. A-2 TaxID=1570360 RepID=UPI0009B50199|nr:DUF6525 family protein [Roseovarius sp. A-2]GAW34610.1 hypothetical protein RA2_01661 [Roseovarius sp. A-2]
MSYRNTGRTSLRHRRRSLDPMREFDRLPPVLRAWLVRACLPWGPRSVLRAYRRALGQTGDTARALEALDGIEARLIARDAARVWGRAHPAAAGPG